LKQLLIVALSAILFTSCIGPRKYAGFIKKYYRDTNISVANTNAQIFINKPDTTGFSSIAKVAKGKQSFIPALFYWGIKESYTCELNPAIPASIFSAAIYADSAELMHNLNGCRLEININSLPNTFTYLNKTSIIFAVFYYWISELQTIIPTNSKVSITYKIYRDASLVKQADIMGIKGTTAFVDNKVSRRRITRHYLDSYDARTRASAEDCLQILNEALMKYSKANK